MADSNIVEVVQNYLQGGEKRWRDEAISPIILIARRDGQVISPRIPVTG